MNDTYATYLQSEAWAATRAKRLALSGFKCEACGERERLQVHHLTYERIFREEMDDLMALCKIHHDAAEEMVGKRVIPRAGDGLRELTLRYIAPRAGMPPLRPHVSKPRPVYVPNTPGARISKSERKRQRKLQKRMARREAKAAKEANKPELMGIGRELHAKEVRQKLCEFEPFLQILTEPNRPTFIRSAKKILRKYRHSARLMANAVLIFEEWQPKSPAPPAPMRSVDAPF